MRKLLRQLFFLDNSAAGAWFGLTLLVTGCYLTGVFALVYAGLGGESDKVLYALCSFLVLAVLLYLFHSWYFCRSILKQFDPVARRLCRLDSFGIAGLTVVAGIVSWEWLWSCGIGVVVLGWYWLFLTGYCQARKYVLPLLLSIFLESIGLFSAILIGSHVFAACRDWWHYLRQSEFSHGPPAFLAECANHLGLGGPIWSLFAAAAILAFAAAYTVRIKTLAALGRQPVRAVFGKRAAGLWLSAFCVFVGGLLLAWHTDREFQQLRQKLETRFGVPLEAETLNRFYRPEETPDAHYWKQLIRLEQQLTPRLRQILDTDRRDWDKLYWEPARRTEVREQLYAFRTEWEQAETMLDQPIPKYPMQFVTDGMWNLEYPHLYSLQQLTKIEFVRLYIALGEEDKSAAMRIYRRLEAMSRYAARDVYSYSFLYLERIRMRGLELLLGSGLLTDTELRQFAVEQEAAEVPLYAAARMALLYDLLCISDFAAAIRSGRLLENVPDPAYSALPPVRVRYAIPYLWWLLRRDEIRLLRLFDREAFEVAVWPGCCPCRASGAFISNYVINYALYCERGFLTLLTRCRAERVLVELELYRRQYGEYPADSNSRLTSAGSRQPLQWEFGPPETKYIYPFGVYGTYMDNGVTEDMTKDDIAENVISFFRPRRVEPRPEWLLRVKDSEYYSGSYSCASMWVAPGNGPVTMSLQCLLETFYRRNPYGYSSGITPDGMSGVIEALQFFAAGTLPPLPFVREELKNSW